MPRLIPRPWVPATCESRVQAIASQTAAADSSVIDARIEAMIQRNAQIHESDCFNLNPATNVMNPRAEAAMARGLGFAAIPGVSG